MVGRQMATAPPRGHPHPTAAPHHLLRPRTRRLAPAAPHNQCVEEGQKHRRRQSRPRNSTPGSQTLGVSNAEYATPKTDIRRHQQPGPAPQNPSTHYGRLGNRGSSLAALASIQLRAMMEPRVSKGTLTAPRRKKTSSYRQGRWSLLCEKRTFMAAPPTSARSRLAAPEHGLE